MEQEGQVQSIINNPPQNNYSQIAVAEKTRLPESRLYDFQPIQNIQYDLEAQQQFVQQSDNYWRSQNKIISIGNFRQIPTSRKQEHFQCRNCNEVVTSLVEYKYGYGSFLLSVLFLFLCLGVGAFFPCCCRSCKDSVHICSNCGIEMGNVRVCDLL